MLVFLVQFIQFILSAGIVTHIWARGNSEKFFVPAPKWGQTIVLFVVSSMVGRGSEPRWKGELARAGSQHLNARDVLN